MVLVRNLKVWGATKTADKWESQPCEVIRQVAPDMPVYIIQDPTNGKERTYHRNKLLPVKLFDGSPVTNTPAATGTQLQAVADPEGGRVQPNVVPADQPNCAVDEKVTATDLDTPSLEGSPASDIT